MWSLVRKWCRMQISGYLVGETKRMKGGDIFDSQTKKPRRTQLVVNCGEKEYNKRALNESN